MIDPKFLWTRAEIEEARDDWRQDFDNRFDLKVLDSEPAVDRERNYIVRSKTNGQLQPYPTWYPDKSL